MKPRHDTFETGDATALICVDDPNLQPIVADQLDALEFKIHTGLFREDIVMRLQMHAYDVLVVHDRFEGGELATNPILAACRELSPEQRRAHSVVLIGADFLTEDGLQAFQLSVDLVCSLSDLGNLAVVLRRSLEERALFYRHFKACLEKAALA
jgi:hypothetical protein